MNWISPLWQEIVEFVAFLRSFFKRRLIGWWTRFEKTKDIIVSVLVARRGKYSQSFLNTSFFLLVASAAIGGPAIAQNNPFIAGYIPQEEASQAVIETDIYSLPVDTQFSKKPRDRVIDHTVKSGETLAMISKQYDVSVESIKWASNLKTDTIRAGHVIKVPPVTGVVHKVGPGESIYSIAKKYKTDPQQIANFPFNDFSDIDTFALTQGQTLYVPDGVVQDSPIRRAPSRGPQIAAGSPGTGNFIWPTSGYVSQNPVWYHMALDIANKGLPPVLAADTGTVSYAGCLRYGYGCHVIINHGNGFQTLYGHLSSLNVSSGQGVGRGSQIGNVGSTGRSTGPHLHFEIRSGGRLMNPLSYLK